MGDVLVDAVPPSAVHLCVDMQRIFSSDGPWPTPWMERVLPTVTRIAERFPERTVFTRFITPATPASATGRWRSYDENGARPRATDWIRASLSSCRRSPLSFRRLACSISPFTPPSPDISSTGICRIATPTPWS